jgi:hypothetical protein
VVASLEEKLVRLAIELATEPPDPEAPSYRDLHPYATFRLGISRPYSAAFLRGLQDAVTGRWEAKRVARLVAATNARPWSLTDTESIFAANSYPRS